MREYGKVHTSFWTSNDIQSLSDDARLLAIYLLTSPHTTIVGAFRLPDGYVCEDLKWSAERVSKGFAELFAKGFGNRCETTKWVWIRKFLQWNPPENPNQWKAAAKMAATIPAQCSWNADFHRVLEDCKGRQDGRQENPCETVNEPFRNQEQEQEQEQKSPTALDEIKSLYPKRSGGQRWQDAENAIKARIREGHSVETIVEGVKRYAAFVKASGSEGTPYVQQAATFLGTNRGFLEPWAYTPPTNGKPKADPYRNAE